MSVRSRLRVFFMFIVVVPIAAVALLLLRISGEIGEGRAQAQLAQAARTAVALHEREARRLEEEADRLAETLERRRVWRMPGARLARLVRRGVAQERYRSAALLGAGDRVLRRIGPAGGLHSALIRFRPLSGRLGPVRAVALSSSAADDFVGRVAELTGSEAVLLEESRPVASSDPALDPEDPREADGEAWHSRRVELGGGAELVLLRSEPALSPLASRPVLVAAFLLLLAVSAGFAWLLSRSVHAQIAALLAAAQRIGSGDLAARVPDSGSDELSRLAREFNRMAELVERQFDRIAAQERRLRRSIRRLGEAMAQGTSRKRLLELALLLACEACDAEYGRLRPAGEPELEVAEARVGEGEAPGPPDQLARELAGELEERACPRPKRASRGRWHALHARLRHEGAIALLRRDRPFTDAELEMFGYLTSQIAVSIENLRLYRRLEREAATDELTGLANRRRFTQLLEQEVARARRFGRPLSLLLLDIDDFKRVNDTHGHAAGDRALRRLARILREETRAVDEPARYGGEEFVVLLPEAGLSEAERIAERIRKRVASTRRHPRYTVSVGAAELLDGEEAGELLERADAALYRAKREGKNRVASAGSEETAGERDAGLAWR